MVFLFMLEKKKYFIFLVLVFSFSLPLVVSAQDSFLFTVSTRATSGALIEGLDHVYATGFSRLRLEVYANDINACRGKNWPNWSGACNLIGFRSPYQMMVMFTSMKQLLLEWSVFDQMGHRLVSNFLR